MAETLAEGIVERVVDHVRQDAVARGAVAFDGDVKHRRGIELMGGDVSNAEDSLKLVEEQGRPVIKLTRIGVIQGVLKLSLVQPCANGDLLRRLHIQRDPPGSWRDWSAADRSPARSAAARHVA
jgi:hypothetical protein